MPITIICYRDVAPNSTETVTWTAPRDGKILYVDATGYETEENLHITVWINDNLNVITYADGSLQYLAPHNRTIRVYCDKQFAKNDIIKVVGENVDTDPEGMHRMRVEVTVELI